MSGLVVPSPPRLLWAISHQTLSKTELPILAEAGFDVVAEEPERQTLWEIDFATYPTIDPVDSTMIPVRATGDLGSRLRLTVRQGLVSSAEARFANDAFDAVMVAGPPLVATNVATWFRGAVLYRWFGNVPGQAPDFSIDLGPAASKILGVPIFLSLVATQLGKSFPRCHVLGTTVPQPPIDMRSGRVHDTNIIAVFAGLIGDEPWFDEWVSRLTAAAGPSDIKFFGVAARRREAVESAGPRVRCLPRMKEDNYWREVAACGLAIYPHSFPHHSHYVPLEAIQLGIPCLMTAQCAIAGEVAALDSVDLRDAGVFGDREALLWWVRDHAQSPRKRAALLRQQQVVLQPFSRRNVLRQARDLREMVASSTVRRRRPSIAPSAQLGVPSAVPLVRALRHGLTSPLALSPATICGPTKAYFSAAYHGQFLVESDGSAVRIRPSREEDSLLRIGLFSAPGDNDELTVGLRCSPVGHLPIVVEQVKIDDAADSLTYTFSPVVGLDRRAGESAWLASMPIASDRFLQLRIVGPLADPGFTVDGVTLNPRPRAGRSPGPSMPAQQALSMGEEVPAVAFAHAALTPVWLNWLCAGRVGAVRVPLGNARPSVLSVRSERIGSGSRAPGFCVVLVRRAAGARAVPVGLFLGGRRVWSRKVRLDRDSVPLILGTGAASLALQFCVDVRADSALEEVGGS